MSGAGNISTAVRASRVSPASSLNFFPTPPWATRALIHEVLRPEGLLSYPRPSITAWEPACGAGHCAIPLRETFDGVFATDVHDWGHGAVRDLDFSFCGPADAPYPIDWVITNPPFTLVETFLWRGLQVARVGVALLVRLQWLEGVDRYNSIFGTPNRPYLTCPFAERVPMIEGAWDPEAKSATAYAWLIWLVGRPMLTRTPTLHIPPGQATRHTHPIDEALANRGEAARRRLAREKEAEVA